MKHIPLILVSAFALVACTPRADEIHFPVMPPEMADCKVFSIIGSNGTSIVAVRCPGSNTTTKSGKQSPTVVIDGATYQKVEE